MDSMDSVEVNKILKFLRLVHNLKYTPRKGWEYFNIQNPERIAGHMYAMSVMTFLLGDNSNLDRHRCLQLAVVHDMSECIVGDITPRDGISVDVKHELEDKALKELVLPLGKDIGSLIYDLYKEYEAQSTPEAKFVKELDRFDMIFTATTYEKRDGEPGKLQEFFDATENKFEHPLMKKLVDGLLKLRDPLNLNDNNPLNTSDNNP